MTILQAVPGEGRPADGIVPAAADRWRVIQLMSVETARCNVPEGNRGRTLADVRELAENMARTRQYVPAVACPNPAADGRFLVLDGVGRLLANRINGTPLWAVCVDRMLTKAELRLMRFSTRNIREHLKPEEVTQLLVEHREETGCTQAELADLFGISESYVCKRLRAWANLCGELQYLYARPEFKPDTVRVIASCKTPEVQKALVERLLPVAERQGRVRRSLALAYKAELEGGKTERKAKRLKLPVGGAVLDAPAECDGEWRIALAKKLIRLGALLKKTPGAFRHVAPELAKTL